MSMTAKRPSHRGLRSLPLLVLAAGVVATACDMARGADPGGAEVTALAATGPRSTAVSETDSVVVQGRPDPDAGELGFGPRFRGPISVAGGVMPTRWPNHPEVHYVNRGSNAHRAGLRADDVILALNGKDARDVAAWEPIRERRPGTQYTLRIRRGQAEHEIRAEIGPRAAE